ncbi:MAG: CBS domain-containing protein [Flavobacteriales bacterium]
MSRVSTIKPDPINAKEIMSTPLVTSMYNKRLADLKALFTTNKISCDPVLNDNREITGIITSTDITAIHNEHLIVRDIMTQRVHVCVCVCVCVSLMPD